MKSEELDQIISLLGKALIKNQTGFADKAKEKAVGLDIADLPYLRTKLHNPPPVHSEIDESKLMLGTWMMACQYAIFELIYHLEDKALDFLKSIAFGEYDWTQATALEVISRLYADEKISNDIIREVDSKLADMREETHLYFAQALVNRSKRDERFTKIITELKSENLRNALNEMGYQLP